MTEQTTQQGEWGTEEPVQDADAASGRSVDVQQMLGQLQGMIDQVATTTTPALKQVAAKAAELAAAAAKRAGPIAISIAAKTDQVSQAVAGRAERLATDLRAPGAVSEDETPGEVPEADRPVAEEETVAASPA